MLYICAYIGISPIALFLIYARKAENIDAEALVKQFARTAAIFKPAVVLCLFVATVGRKRNWFDILYAVPRLVSISVNCKLLTFTKTMNDHIAHSSELPPARYAR